MRTLKLVIIVSVMTTLLTGCSHHGGFDINRMFKSVSTTARVNYYKSVNADAGRFIENDNAVAALDLIEKDGPDNRIFQKNRLRALDLLYMQATALEVDRNFQSAGLKYRQLLTHLPANMDRIEGLRYGMNDILAKRELCAEKLLQTGLVSYRSGDLESAIQTWSQIRTFHPTFKASQIAIKTTKTQLKKLDLLN